MKSLKLKSIILVLSAVIFAFNLIACKPRVDPDSKIDKTKQQIYVSVYLGGHGSQWADDAAKEYNKLIAGDGYEVIIQEEKRVSTDIIAEIKTGRCKDMYISADSNFITGIYGNNLEDLTDVWNTKPDADGPTVGEKMTRPEEWLDVYRNNITGKGVYALPYFDAITGLVYDHQLFVEKEWCLFANAATDGAKLTAQGIEYTNQSGRLVFVSSSGRTNYKPGDYILTAGKDGKYGTYDDGQPVGETQWADMLDRITQSKRGGYPNVPFIWSGEIKDYVTDIYSALFAQYGGPDDFNTYFNYDSGGKNVSLQTSDGPVEKPISVTNGYDVFKMQSLVRAYEFLKTYFTPDDHVHSATEDTTVNHLAAQKLFLSGFLGSSSNREAAMLVEGAWWEYEARNVFKDIEKSYDSERGYGMRDYRYMLLPDLTGQKAGKTYFGCGESGVIVIPKIPNNTETKLALTKEFLLFVYKDETLRHTTKITGNVFPMNYALTEDDRAGMTPFARNMLDIYYDEEHIGIARSRLAVLRSPINYLGRVSNHAFPVSISQVITVQVVEVAKKNSIESIKTALQNTYTSTNWPAFISTCKANGFFPDIIL